MKAKVTYMSSSLAGGKPWNLVRGVAQRHLTGHFHSTEVFVQKYATTFVSHDIFIFFRGVSIFLLLLQQDINCTLFSGAMNFLCVQPPNSESVFEILGVVLENTISSAPPQ